MFTFFEDIGGAIADVANIMVTPIVQIAEATGLDDVINEVVDTLEEVGQAALDGLEDLGEDIVDGLVAFGEEMDEAFSKEGWMTEFFEEYVPAGGLVTAMVHAAAGNEAHAQMAALKGAVTSIEALAAAAGTVALGPVGGALGAGIGNGLGQLLEISLRDELPEEVRHLIPERSWDEALLEMGGAVAGGAIGGGAGKAFGAGKRVFSSAAKEAAAEAVEKSTTRLMMTSLGKKLAFSPAKPGFEAAQREAGLDPQERRGSRPGGPPVTEEQVEAAQQKATIDFLAASRYEQTLYGATAEDLQQFDRQIFTANARIDYLENPTADPGSFVQEYRQGLGVYYERNGVVVWDADDIAEAQKEIELDRLGYTEEELQDAIEQQMENSYRYYTVDGGQPPQHPEWTQQFDSVLGVYMIKEGEVVWGATTAAEADSRWGLEEVQERGFASVEEYRDELVNSWRVAHQYAVEAGNATGEWQMGGQGDIVGPYMIKDGQIVWGASNAYEAEAMLPDQLAQEKGFEDADDMRAELVNSWRVSHQYDVEAGRTELGWQVGGQSDVVGPYMIKDGVVVFGAETEAQAEEMLPDALAQSRGFESVEDYQQELETSWRMSYNYDVEAGTDNDEWQVGGQSEITGPYMILRGEIAWGATTVEEAQEIMKVRINEEFELFPVDEEASGDTTDEEYPENFDDLDPEDVETPVYIVDEPDDGAPFDVRNPPTQMHPEEPETPVLIVDEPDDGKPFVDVRNPPTHDHETPDPEPVGQEATIAQLMAEIAALREEIEELREESEADQPEPEAGTDFRTADMVETEDGLVSRWDQDTDKDIDEPDEATKPERDIDEPETGTDFRTADMIETEDGLVSRWDQDTDKDIDEPEPVAFGIRVEGLRDRLRALGYDPETDGAAAGGDARAMEIREILGEISEIEAEMGIKVDLGHDDPPADDPAPEPAVMIDDPLALPDDAEESLPDPTPEPDAAPEMGHDSKPDDSEVDYSAHFTDPETGAEVMASEIEAPADEEPWIMDEPMVNPDEEQNL